MLPNTLNDRAIAFRIAVNLATGYQRKIKLGQTLTLELEAAALAGCFKSSEAGPEQNVMAQRNSSVSMPP